MEITDQLHKLQQENERLRSESEADARLAARAGFIEGFQYRQDLIEEEAEKVREQAAEDASKLWLLLPLWFLGSSLYTAYVLLTSVFQAF